MKKGTFTVCEVSFVFHKRKKSFRFERTVKNSFTQIRIVDSLWRYMAFIYYYYNKIFLSKK